MSLNTPAFTGWPKEPEWMKAFRARARAEATDQPWPHRRVEEWHRTDVTGFQFENRQPLPAQQGAVKAGSPLEGFSGYLKSDGATVTVWLSPALTEQGVQLLPLGDVILGKGVAKPDALDAVFSEMLRQVDNKVPALHAALLGSGVFLSVPAQVVIEAPLLIELTEAQQDSLSSPHVVINAGRASQFQVVLRRSSSEAPLTVNSGMQLLLDEGAVVTLVDVQEYGSQTAWVDHSQARLGRDAQLFHWSAQLGGRLVKTDLALNLEGEGASLKTHGLYFAVQDQHKDIRVVQNHRAPNTSSYALYKGAVRDRSRTVFQGLIEVAPQAPRTDAYLSNKNLVLTDGARADSLPQLKIDTNDVKCSHGSTTGKVNEDEVFYLMSRGFSRAEARLLIAEGLFADLIAEAPEFLRQDIEGYVVRALGAP